MKVLFYALMLLLGQQACSNAPTPASGNGAKASDSILTDTSGVALGNSPNGAFRLFKTQLPSGENALKVLRLKDLYQALVATSKKDQKFYWSKDSRYLIADNDAPDTAAYKQQVVFFNLFNFQIEALKNGQLIGFDPLNDMTFLYRYTNERQQIVYFDLNKYEQETQREILTPPGDKVPSSVVHPKERMIKVKAYMSDGVPVNIGFNY